MLKSSSGLTAAASTSFQPIDSGLTFGRYARVVGSAAILFLVTLAVVPWIGSAGISFSGVWNGVYPDREIFMLARLPRILFGALAGSSLAVSGVLFQAILRNPLATPYTLGVSSGGSFGAVLAIWLGLNVMILGFPVVALASFAGAMMTIFLVFAISRTRDHLPTFTLLLAGVTLNFVFAALITFLHYASNFQQSYLMMRWMMGSLDTADFTAVLRVFPIVAIALILLNRFAGLLNPFAAGEEWAMSRGVPVERFKTACYFIASVLTGSVTAFAGPVGFVGLIVPHALRLIVGSDNRLLVPASMFLGAAFLMWCDTAARTLFAPTEIPVGVITGLLGGPFFIVLLRQGKAGLWRS